LTLPEDGGAVRRGAVVEGAANRSSGRVAAHGGAMRSMEGAANRPSRRMEVHGEAAHFTEKQSEATLPEGGAAHFTEKQSEATLPED